MRFQVLSAAPASVVINIRGCTWKTAAVANIYLSESMNVLKADAEG